MQIFSRYSNSLNASIEAAYKDALNQKAKEVSTGHLLLGLLGNHDNIAHQALVSMNVNYKNVNKELERLNVQTKESSSFLETELPLVNTSNELALSSQARQALCLAHEVRIFFGKSEIEPEHVLLALVDHTHVAVDVKVRWLIGNKLCDSISSFKQAMATSYAGEVSPPQ